ncbi:MAG: iron-containing alcohol dehydrogenase, partial [Gemmatimonadota bacterium]
MAQGIEVNEELFEESEFLDDPERQAELRAMLKFDQRRVLLGVGACGELGEECHHLGARRVLLVRDPAVKRLAETARHALQQGGVQVVEEYTAIVANPTTASVDDLAAVVGRTACDAVVAMGGGSTLDSAKVALSVATSGGSTEDYLGFDRFPGPARWPLLALPTTSGTGAEASRVAVIVAAQGKQAIY